MCVLGAAAYGGEEGKRRLGDGIQITNIASEAVGSAMAEQIGAEDGVTPSCEGDGYLLKEPAGIGAITVGHEDGSLNGARSPDLMSIGRKDCVNKRPWGVEK
ncbi:hypothetical protein HPP92_003251 [Vanilla planifolia]|uniref:Uncharacterized protein n=1 Tax=Vanilla planifolia TaxID=51239 RepID=A0A835S2W3_VANPL|nr:hypothetical protein HPP92_003251 [Vanilla planifolia]